MTVELILILSIWATILLSVFFGDNGPIQTFRDAGPRLAARVEKNLATGRHFRKNTDGTKIKWATPPQRGQ